MVDGHDPDGETDSRVYVNGTRIPVFNAEIFMRKEGNLDITRYLECEFAAPYDGEDYTGLFGSLTPETQSNASTVRVDVRDNVTDEYHVQFQGLVTGVGNAAEGPPQRWSFRAEGPGHRLSEIPASKRFADATLRDVLRYVTERFANHSPLVASVGDVDQPETIVRDDGEGDGLITVNVPFTGVSFETPDPTAPSAALVDAGASVVGAGRPFTPYTATETFQFGKHTLADVVQWVGRTTSRYIWFEPTPAGVVLVAVKTPLTQHHTAHYLGGDTRVENNDALAELKPVNTLVLKAPAKDSVEQSNTYQVGERGETILSVKARHEPLYERAGGVELHADTHRLDDAMTKVEAENKARKLLKEAVDVATSGDMQTLLRGPATPFDTITALPTCSGDEAVGVDALTYEASRITQAINGSGFSETEWNVGVHTDPVEDIHIIDSWRPEAE